VEILFCGTRGSMPAPGAAFVRYGGHTSCVALAHDAGQPSLVLDAGSGLVNLDKVLGEEPFRGTILIGHLHWDHTHGMPFFAAGTRPGHRVQVLMPEQGEDAERLLARAMSPPHFPIEPAALGEGWQFAALEQGDYEFEGFAVSAREIPHKGGRTFGFRVSDGTGAVAYLSDHNPLALGPGPLGVGELHPAAVTLASNVDLLIHDAQYTAEELPELGYMGHSCPEYAIALAQRAAARRVCLFHHSPRRTDASLDELATRFALASVPVTAASDGLPMTVSRRGASGSTQLRAPAQDWSGLGIDGTR
jgi:phosphoribosyl 1,2-cyclic phosphodiesterase